MQYQNKWFANSSILHFLCDFSHSALITNVNDSFHHLKMIQ